MITITTEDILMLVSFGASTAMVFGGIVPYIPQYLEILQTKNADGFSTHVCLALLLANTLRIFFWIGHPFEMPLLLQSFVMNIAMLVMLRLCVKTKSLTEINIKTKTIFECTINNFWQWTNFQDYLIFLVIFSTVVGGITIVLMKVPIYMETLGFVSVFIESMLGAPQFYKNYCKKNTVGMSVKMVLCWFSGDTFKTVYFLIRHAPPQFWICGSFQVCIDMMILLQVYMYRPRKQRP